MDNLNKIIKDEKLLMEQLHNHTLTGSYLSLSIKILNRKREVLIGKTIEEVVEEVKSCDEIVWEFAVATEKNKKINKSKNGFHKIVNRSYNDTGFIFDGEKEQIPVFQRIFN